MSKSKRSDTTSNDSSLQLLEQRHHALLAELADLGLVLRGSIDQRLRRCGNPTCRCRTNPPQLHGPYWQWTRKVAGKTVSATLTPAQAARCRDWNGNMHELDRIVGELQEIGLRAAEVVCGR